MTQSRKTRLIQQHGAERVVDRLAPFVTTHRQERINKVIAGRLRCVHLAIEEPSDLNNALAAVRSSEALGIAGVHIICPEGEAQLSRTITQGAIYWIPVRFYDSLSAFLQFVAEHHLQLVGGVVDAVTPLSAVLVSDPLCIILGNEKRGLSATAQAACTIRYKIPMYGMTESFNLSVSAAISLYEITHRKRVYLGADTDLTGTEQQHLRAEFYLNSVAPRLAETLLKKQD